MIVSINNINNKANKETPSFKGPIDGALTSTLAILDTSPMLNAVALDVCTMAVPRTIIDTRERNKYAGAETAFREFSATFIACVSTGVFALGLSKLMDRLISPEVKVKSSWATNNALDMFSDAWKNGGGETGNFVRNILTNISGRDGNATRTWGEIDWGNTQWYEEKSWDKIKWKNPAFKDIQNRLKDEKSVINILSDLINDKSIDKKDAKNILKITEARIGNALKSSKDIQVALGDKRLDTSLSNLLRDVTDTGKNLFTNTGVSLEEGLKKLRKINNIKTYGALALSIVLGVTNQYINRKITEKRTGTDDFVGNIDYVENLNKKDENKEKGSLLIEKTVLSSAFALMLAKVLDVKGWKDFLKKLEVTGPVTSGNAIKVVFGAIVLGRLLAATDKTELRETAVRDYLAFLNWLVLGGFVAKGVAKLLDKGQGNLFNGSSLKSHAEIAARGGEYVTKHLRQLNAAHLSGLAYSAVVLGVVLPKFNIWATKKLHKNKNEGENKPVPPQTASNVLLKRPLPPAFKAFEKKCAS